MTSINIIKSCHQEKNRLTCRKWNITHTEASDTTVVYSKARYVRPTVNAHAAVVVDDKKKYIFFLDTNQEKPQESVSV